MEKTVYFFVGRVLILGLLIAVSNPVCGESITPITEHELVEGNVELIEMENGDLYFRQFRAGKCKATVQCSDGMTQTTEFEGVVAVDAYPVDEDGIDIDRSRMLIGACIPELNPGLLTWCYSVCRSRVPSSYQAPYLKSCVAKASSAPTPQLAPTPLANAEPPIVVRPERSVLVVK